MSLLSGLITAVSNIALKPAVAIGNVISNLIKPGSGTTTSSQLANTTAGKILGTATAGAVVALGGAIAGAGSIGAGLAKAIPTTAKGKAIAVASTIVGVSAVASNPIGTTEAIGKVPGALANVGTNIGEFSANPTLQGAIDIAKENPVLVGAGALAIGSGIAGTVATILNTRATKENTQTIIAPSDNNIPVGSSTLENPISNIPASTQDLIQPETAVGNNDVSGSPLTTPTKTITIGKKRYKKHKAETSSSIRNNVHIQILNQATGQKISNKRYLKEVVYA